MTEPKQPKPYKHYLNPAAGWCYYLLQSVPRYEKLSRLFFNRGYSGYPNYLRSIEDPEDGTRESGFPNMPLLFLFGQQKPFMFHSEGWAADVAARTDGSRVRGFYAGHWFYLEEAQKGAVRFLVYGELQGGDCWQSRAVDVIISLGIFRAAWYCLELS